MRNRITILCAALCLLAATTMGQGLPVGSATTGPVCEPAAADFDVWTSSVGDETLLHFQLTGASGDAFAVFASLAGSDEAGPPSLVGVAPLGEDGSGAIECFVRAMPGTPFEFTAAYKLDKRMIFVTGPIPIGGQTCDTLDFDYTLGADWVMASGQVIAEQWADIGMHVSARNKVIGKPDKAILFDSDVPSLHDPDLVVGEGQLLIIPEDDIDVAPFDGYVDVPNDAMKGGSMFFDFDKPYALARIRLVDFDEPGSQLKFYRNHDVVTPEFVIDIPVHGDGMVQTLAFDQRDVTRLEIALKASGGVIGLCGIPCPRVVNFDETPFGRPLGFPAGLVVGNQFYDSGLGLRISAINGHTSPMLPAQNHPDVALLFDSDFPSGGDWDLFAQVGNILIIGEDDFDWAPVDGLVDDPDDEAEGGVLIFDLGRNITGFRATIVDIDELAGPSELRCYDEAMNMIGAPIPLVSGPDGNVQVITAEVDGMRRLELESQGSAAVAELRYCIEDDD